MATRTLTSRSARSPFHTNECVGLVQLRRTPTLARAVCQRDPEASLAMVPSELHDLRASRARAWTRSARPR